MIASVAQLIALTNYGNAYLQNDSPPNTVNISNSTLKFCNKVRFVQTNSLFWGLLKSRSEVANCPKDWFAFLKENGCNALVLQHTISSDQSFAKDYKLAGLIGGGGNWLIEAKFGNYSNFWNYRWEITDKDAENQKIWTVTYATSGKKQPSSNLQFDTKIAKDQLRQSLHEINEFAILKHLTKWNEVFTKALFTLNSETPGFANQHKDLIPPFSSSLIAQQLLFSASKAWVFGDIGSWNDVSFDNNEDSLTHDALSDKLYANVVQAILAATNTLY